MKREATMQEMQPAGALIGVIITAVCGLLVAFVTGFWSWLSGRKKGAADSQSMIQAGFSNLVDQLQEEREQHRKVIIDQNNVIAVQASEIMALRGEIRQLTQEIQSLYRLLNESGVIIPPELKS